MDTKEKSICMYDDNKKYTLIDDKNEDFILETICSQIHEKIKNYYVYINMTKEEEEHYSYMIIYPRPQNLTIQLPDYNFASRSFICENIDENKIINKYVTMFPNDVPFTLKCNLTHEIKHYYDKMRYASGPPLLGLLLTSIIISVTNLYLWATYKNRLVNETFHILSSYGNYIYLNNVTDVIDEKYKR